VLTPGIPDAAFDKASAVLKGKAAKKSGRYCLGAPASRRSISIHAHKVEQGETRHWQRTEHHADYEKTLGALGIEVPPVIWKARIKPASKLSNRLQCAS
jgi:hypothetical protein